MLAEQDVEDDAVDAVVPAEDGDRTHDVAGLPETVDSTFALLVAGGVPGQVVVDDGLEVLLEVDALGEAVGGDEHVAAGVAAELGDPLLAQSREGGCR